MGSDTYGYTKTNRGETIVMRFNSKDPILVNKEIPISINMDNTYIFDAETETCISFPEKNGEPIKLQEAI